LKNKLTVVQPPKLYNDLSRRHKHFVEHYVRTGDEAAAYLAAGYRDTKRTNASARSLKLELARFIDEALGDYVQSTDIAVMAINQVRSLAESADSEAIRLQAAKELLSRGGWDKPKEVTVHHNHNNMTNEAIDTRIEELQKKLFIDAPKAEVVHEPSTEEGLS
jgi:phage terminase small subunit